MNDIVISLLVVGLVPLLSFGFFKANMAIVFFATCVSLVLLRGLDPAVVSTSGALLPGPGESYVRVSVVAAAILLTSLVFRHRVRHGAGLFILYGLLTVIIIALLWIVLPGMTGLPLLMNAADEPAWSVAHNYETFIVMTGFIISLLILRKAK